MNYLSMPIPRELSDMTADIKIVSYQLGDVNGDKVLDHIYLVGQKPFGDESPFVDNITLIVQSGRTNEVFKVPLKTNAGYNPTIYLADLTGNRTNEIFISIDSGGSGGFGFFYVYSFMKNIPQKLFDYEEFNSSYTYEATFRDHYKVEISNKTLKKLFSVDISTRDATYLSEYYLPSGVLITPLNASVSGISSLNLIDYERDGVYELRASQRVVGSYNADTIAYIETPLRWNGKRFVAMRSMQYALIPPTEI